MENKARISEEKKTGCLLLKHPGAMILWTPFKKIGPNQEYKVRISFNGGMLISEQELLMGVRPDIIKGSMKSSINWMIEQLEKIRVADYIEDESES